MKTHLTEEEVFEMAFEKLGIANPKVDKLHEIAKLMDLEFDEDKQLYHNPNCCHCGKVLDKIDLQKLTQMKVAKGIENAADNGGGMAGKSLCRCGNITKCLPMQMACPVGQLNC